ncbi:MAG: hypothetical protein WED11_00155 [Natronospirillum sp.]
MYSIEPAALVAAIKTNVATALAKDIAGADVIMLDNFSLDDTRTAVTLAAGEVKIEASGGVNELTLVDIARTGVDYISMGTLTKDVTAIDLSMRLAVVHEGFM